MARRLSRHAYAINAIHISDGIAILVQHADCWDRLLLFQLLYLAVELRDLFFKAVVRHRRVVVRQQAGADEDGDAHRGLDKALPAFTNSVGFLMRFSLRHVIWVSGSGREIPAAETL